LPSVTSRQAVVLRLVAVGRSNKQIAWELGVTERCAKDHVSRLLALFKVPNRAALAVASIDALKQSKL
jgi:DNA-binding NarL/FixJ family response regulator